jgi:hypothetical protein
LLVEDDVGNDYRYGTIGTAFVSTLAGDDVGVVSVGSLIEPTFPVPAVSAGCRSNMQAPP